MNKSKNFIKTFVFAFAFLLTLALTLGITGAWYNTRRQADGVITMSDGIVIEYSGFGQGSGEWQNNSADFLLFATNNEAGPGTTATLNGTGIKAGSGSADFFVRAKLEYKFFTDVEGLTDVTSQIADYSAFINTPTFAQGWVDGRNGDGWFYYATGSTFNTLPSADYVNVFTPGQSITLNGAADGFNHQGGGYRYSSEILIKRITVSLTLEAYQADLAAAANAGWTIVPAYTDAASVVYTQNANGTWTLTDGTALSNNSSSSTATYEARMYDSSYSYTVLSTINNQDVVAIGDNAFLNASQLTEITIPATVASVGTNAFTGTGLNTVTIEKDDAVVSGIETAGIPTASTINVPAAVSGNYEILLPSNNVVAAASPTPAASVGLDYEYDSENQSYTVTGMGTCTDTALVIPSETDYEGNGLHPVTGVRAWGFYGHSELISISIPSTIISLGDGAFGGCDGLIEIIYNGRVSGNVNNNVLTGAGNNNTGIIVTIGEGVIEIPGDLFWNISKITEVRISSTVQTIGEGAFAGCTGLNEIVIPNSVENICNSAFSNCTSLSSIQLSNSLVNLGVNAFAGTAITSITLPVGITNLSDQLFRNCSNLVQVICLGSITYIGVESFAFCSSLSSINIPSSVLTIAESAFTHSGLTSVVFEGNRQADLTIRGEAFLCSSLTSVTFSGDWEGINVTLLPHPVSLWMPFAGSPVASTVQIPNQ